MAIHRGGRGPAHLSRLTRPSGATPAPTPGVSPTVTGQTHAVHYHVHTATMTNFSDVAAANGDRVKSLADLMALANAAGPDTSNAPILMTDALGRKFLRFRSGGYMTIANALTAMNNRALTVIFVGRVHKAKAVNIFYPRYTTAAASAQVTGRAGALASVVVSNSAAFLFNGDASPAGLTGDELVIPGAQMQVLVLNALSGTNSSRVFVNNDYAQVAQSSAALTDMTGAVIGGAPAAADAITQTTTQGFDLYELIVIKGTVSNANAAIAAAAAVTNYAIPAVTSQLVIEGDSRLDPVVVGGTQTDAAHSDYSPAMLLTTPGAELIPTTCRALNTSTSGSTRTTLTTRRDATNGMFAQTLPGGSANNKVAFEDSTNDFAAGDSAATHYAGIKTLLHTGSATGYLERGWDACVITPPAVANGTNQAKNVTYRASLVNDLVTDMTAISAGYASRVSVLQAHLIQVASATIFEDSTDAASLTYYQANSGNPAITDGVHQTGTGLRRYVDGGQTPQYGIGSVL